MSDSTKKAQKRADALLDKDQQGCILQQFTMFDCDRNELEMKGNVKCYPIPRVFRTCPGRPAIEVTALLRYQDPSGDPVLPKDYLQNLPKVKPGKTR